MRLLFQFYKIDSVYLFSLQSKKCLLKSGKVSSSSVPLCPLVGLFVPVTRASTAHQVGIGSPCAGQSMPIMRAMSAQTSDLFLGDILLIL